MGRPFGGFGSATISRRQSLRGRCRFARQSSADGSRELGAPTALRLQKLRSWDALKRRRYLPKRPRMPDRRVGWLWGMARLRLGALSTAQVLRARRTVAMCDLILFSVSCKCPGDNLSELAIRQSHDEIGPYKRVGKTARQVVGQPKGE